MMLKSKVQFLKYFLLLFLLAGSFIVEAQDAKAGKKLFMANCASCHKLDKKVIGPALAGVTGRRSKDWLYKWIRNNAELRASGDADAIAIFEEYGGSVMNAFPQLSDEDIDNILAYTDAQPVAPPSTDGGSAVSGSSGSSSTDNGVLVWVLLGLAILLAGVLVLLTKILTSLQALIYAKENKEEDVAKVYEDIKSNTKPINFQNYAPGFILAGFLFYVIALYGAWNYMSAIDVNKGYEPIQPIAFSHKLHAGDNKIDCKYCHSSVKYSKTSGIPSANVCMNCHRYISEGPKYGTEEIQKIYDAVGWDVNKQQYIEGYEEKPIEWVKIHNLPDFVYFNHSQHIMVGGLECQECHGPVEEMEKLYQYSDLTMGWCVNCHRETGVKVKGNAYYEKIHEQLAKKHGVDKVTVEMIGGLECGKCHY